jgi:hypothetical protein
MYLWDDVILSGDPVGAKLIGAPVKNSRRIDLSVGVLKAAALLICLEPFSAVDFSQLHDCFPPLSGKNLFVDFEATSAFYDGKNHVSRIGIHIVDWNICSSAFMVFQKMKLVNIARFEEIFGFVFYLQRSDKLEYLPLGVRVGMDLAGEIVLMDFFSILPREISPSGKEVSKLKKQLPWYVYLVLSAFSDINREVLGLRALDENVFITGANTNRGM